MNVFKRIFGIESRRLFCRRNIIIFLVLLILLTVFILEGVIEYKSILKNRKTFQETEKLKVNQYILITQYGAYGLRVMFIPSPLSIIFNNSGLFKDLMSNVDVGERLNIYNSVKGRKVFDEPGGFMDVSGFLLLFGSLLGLLYGFDAFRNNDYLKLLLRISNRKTLFFPIVFSRIILLNMLIWMLAFISLVLPLVYGIDLFNSSFLVFAFVLSLVITFFIIFGSIIGMFKKKVTGFLTLVGVFFIFAFVCPWMVNKTVRINAGSLIPNYKVELEKLKIIMSFEERFLKEVGIFRSGEEAPEHVKNLVQSYIDNEYKRILEIEEKAKKGIIEKISDYQYISAFFPTTFYFSAGFELCSRGYLNFIDFYSYNQSLKDGFFKYYIHKKYYAPTSEIESYIKNNKNLYLGTSRLPGNMKLGVFLILFYIAVLYYIGTVRFRKTVNPLPEKKNAFDRLDIALKKGTFNTFDVYDDDFARQIFNIFSGKIKCINGKLSIDGTPMVTEAKKDFLYLPNPGMIPGDISVFALTNLFKNMLKPGKEEMEPFKPWIFDKKKTFQDLEREQKARFLLTAARLSKRKVLILCDFFFGIPTEYRAELTSMIDDLKKDGTIIIDIIPNHNIFIVPDYHSSIKYDGKYYVELEIKRYNESF